jgi:UDP-N-acetylmuramate--alanine ligase
VRGWELDPVDLELAVPGEHNRRNAAARTHGARSQAWIARLPSAQSSASPAWSGGSSSSASGEAFAWIDDYAHNPTEIAATLRTARGLADRRLVAVYQPHVYERTRHLLARAGSALGLADAAIVTDVIGGRDPALPA